MKLAKIEITIKGMSPLLMHAFPTAEIKSFEKLSKEEQAELAVYRVPNSKELYVPGIALQRALVSAATFSKGKGRATLQKIVAACVQIEPEYCLLNQQTYDIDSRPVVVPATKGRVMRHRPRFNDWMVSFTATFDQELLTENQLRTIVEDTGSRIGLLDFRPERKGSFGRFMITKWEKI